jgi:precorrin-2 dehydrogenase/sirohydrochlorin ferrochelatase
MLPIVIDMKGVRIGIAGHGDGLRRKLDLVANAGPEAPAVFENREPTAAELVQLQILFVAGLDDALSAKIAHAARAASVLVNVEDVPALCNFHVPAQVRRGDLLIAISTGGHSPALSRVLREKLEEQFAPEWALRLEELARWRVQWRGQGVSASDISLRTRAYLDEKGWL